LKENANALWELKKLAVLQRVREGVAAGGVVSVVLSVGTEVVTLFSTADLPIGESGHPVVGAARGLATWLAEHDGALLVAGLLVTAVALPLALLGRKRLRARLPPRPVPPALPTPG
jgi:hypothetical protein